MESVTLHCCNYMWIRAWLEPCARVRKALDDAGVPYEMVHHPTPREPARRAAGDSGQSVLPAIEFADGRVYREESKDMAARIAAGKLVEG